MLDKINRNLNKLNRTTQNLRMTQNNVRQMTGQGRGGGFGFGGAQRNAGRNNAQPQANEWECKCGQINTTKFCGSCGESPARCVKCLIVVQTAFCPECGEKIETE